MTSNPSAGHESYRCAACAQFRDGLAFVFAADAPLAWEQLDMDEPSEVSVLDDELSVIRNAHFFIRGLLEIPVIGTDEQFAWNVWSSPRRDSFGRAISVWDSPDRTLEPPYFGREINALALHHR